MRKNFSDDRINLREVGKKLTIVLNILLMEIPTRVKVTYL